MFIVQKDNGVIPHDDAKYRFMREWRDADGSRHGRCARSVIMQIKLLKTCAAIPKNEIVGR
jgi:hypothetical protein